MNAEYCRTHGGCIRDSCAHCKLEAAHAEIEMQKVDKERIRKERDYLRDINEGMRAENADVITRSTSAMMAMRVKIDAQEAEIAALNREAAGWKHTALERTTKLEEVTSEWDAAIAALEEISKMGSLWHPSAWTVVAREALAALKGGAT